MATIALPAGTAALRTAALRASGPVFAVVSLTQAAAREGFDLTRHPLSMLSLGDLGWIQITNFLVTGALMLAGSTVAVPGWTRRLLVLAGAGMIGAGLFSMDPGLAFPVGTPDTTPTTMTWHAVLHMVSGTTTFLSLIAACFVLARHLAGRKALTSRTVGAFFAVCLAWCMAGATWGPLTLAAGAITALLWLSATADRP